MCGELSAKAARRESMDEIDPEDHLRKNESLRFSWEFMTDQAGCI